MAAISRRTFIKHMAVGGGTIAWLCVGLDFANAAGPETFKLRIIHTNDHHARIEPVMGGTPSAPIHGGVARRKTLIDAIRKQGGNQILIDAGDVFQGTLWYNQYLGQADLEFYNALGYEAMTIGNHEFDNGQEPLAAFIKGASFPVLSANIKVDSSSPLNGLIKPWIIKEVGGQRIGIFGLTTDETAILSNPGPGVVFENYLDAARQAVAELKAEGVNKIIALTHIGITYDRILASQVDGIQVIIGGHSHTPMGPQVSPADPNRPYPEVHNSPSGKPVIVATDWEWGRWLGDLTIGFDDNGDVTGVVAAQPTEVAASVPADPGFEARIGVLAQPLVELRAKVIGEASVPLNGSRADVRVRETNLGNLIADAMLEKTKGAGAQIALMNGGGIRASIDQGPITVGEVLEVQPFGNILTLVTLTGAQLKEALENSVSQVEDGAGRFMQIAGGKYTWNPAAEPGNRIVAVEVGGAPLDLNANYRIITLNFLVAGGDGYEVLTQGTNIIDTGFLDSDVTIEYIQNHSPVSPSVEGRIVESATAAVPAPAPAPSEPAPAPVPAELPRTGGDLSPMWWLAALGASAIGSGLRLRNRARRAEVEAEAALEAEAVREEENELVA